MLVAPAPIRGPIPRVCAWSLYFAVLVACTRPSEPPVDAAGPLAPAGTPPSPAPFEPPTAPAVTPPSPVGPTGPAPPPVAIPPEEPVPADPVRPPLPPGPIGAFVVVVRGETIVAPIDPTIEPIRAQGIWVLDDATAPGGVRFHP